MIFDSLLLMGVGMGVVLLFLFVLMILIIILGKLLRTHTQNEERLMLEATKNKGKKEDKSKIVAIITAAIRSHRKARGLF